MVSILAQSSLGSLQDRYPKIQLNELGNLHDAIEPFTHLVRTNGRSAVRLHCSVPTWSASSDTCLDLHDLHELRSRFLLFVHDLLQSLRSSGITASYSLAPSNSSLCLICAMPPELSKSQIKSTANALQSARLTKRENVLLADLEYGPCLIIT